MYYRVLVLLAVFWASAVQAGNNAGGAFTVWPDTAQSKCYDNNGEIPCPAEGQDFYGQDAQYQGPARSYTKLDGSGNPLPEDAASWVMVRDNVTGLIWEVKENGDGTEDYTNSNDADNIYTWCDTNPDTNGGDQGSCGEHDTEDFIDALNSTNFGGHNDWRLPTLKELLTIVDYARENPAIDTAFFPDTAWIPIYWSATTDADNDSRAWLVSFSLGFDASGDKSLLKRYVRAVRGGSGSTALFTGNGDGTVTDTATGLMWTRASADTDTDGTPDTMSWQAALNWCQNLELAGYTDWRLPNINELHSIVDYARHDPAIDPTFSPDTINASYWSATTSSRADNTSKALGVYFGPGNNNNNPKLNYNYHVRCVRGGQFAAFAFDPITDQIAGKPFQIRITARDTEGNIWSVYNGSVQLSSTIGIIIPGVVQLVMGQAIVDVVLVSSGETRLYADDGIHPQGQSNVFTVSLPPEESKPFSWPMFLPWCAR